MVAVYQAQPQCVLIWTFKPCMLRPLRRLLHERNKKHERFWVSRVGSWELPLKEKERNSGHLQLPAKGSKQDDVLHHAKELSSTLKRELRRSQLYSEASCSRAATIPLMVPIASTRTLSRSFDASIVCHFGAPGSALSLSIHSL